MEEKKCCRSPWTDAKAVFLFFSSWVVAEGIIVTIAITVTSFSHLCHNCYHRHIIVTIAIIVTITIIVTSFPHHCHNCHHCHIIFTSWSNHCHNGYRWGHCHQDGQRQRIFTNASLMINFDDKLGIRDQQWMIKTNSPHGNPPSKNGGDCKSLFSSLGVFDL